MASIKKKHHDTTSSSPGSKSKLSKKHKGIHSSNSGDTETCSHKLKKDRKHLKIQKSEKEQVEVESRCKNPNQQKKRQSIIQTNENGIADLSMSDTSDKMPVDFCLAGEDGDEEILPNNNNISLLDLQVSDSDDKPFGRSFDSSKNAALAFEQVEQVDAQRSIQSKKNKKTAKQCKEKKKKGGSLNSQSIAIDDDDHGQEVLKDKMLLGEESSPIELLPDNVIQGALEQDEYGEDFVDMKLEKGEAKQSRRNEMKLKIESKAVQVVALKNSNQSYNFQQRIHAAKQAEAFLNEHFWGARLERVKTDQYISERVTGPAVHFLVANAEEQLKLSKTKSKTA